MNNEIVGSMIVKMAEYFSGDVRRINHALKVFGFAKGIAGGEGLSSEQRLILDLAALLHDIGIKESERKYTSSAGPYQEKEGPPVAREILHAFNLNKEIVDRICFLIGHHHTYNSIDGLDFQILVEADFLVNIYEEEIKEEAVRSIKEKYFKTSTGGHLIDSLYL